MSWTAPPSDQVGPAVTDLGEIEVAAEHARGGHRGPHAADFGVLAGIGEDLGIGQLDRLPHPVGEPVSGGTGSVAQTVAIWR